MFRVAISIIIGSIISVAGTSTAGTISNTPTKAKHHRIKATKSLLEIAKTNAKAKLSKRRTMLGTQATMSLLNSDCMEDNSTECSIPQSDFYEFGWTVDTTSITTVRLEVVEVSGFSSCGVWIGPYNGETFVELADCDLGSIGAGTFYDWDRASEASKNDLQDDVDELAKKAKPTAKVSVCDPRKELLPYKDVTSNTGEREIYARGVYFALYPNTPATERIKVEISWTDGTVEVFQAHTNGGTLTLIETKATGNGIPKSACN